MRASSHIPDRLDVRFDGDHLVTDSRLVLAATSPTVFGLRELVGAGAGW